jgi:hypothetical protein
MSENHTDKPSSTDLESLRKKSVKELKEIAKSIGLKGVSALRKESLIERISNHRGSGPRDTGVPNIEYGQESHIQSYDSKRNAAAATDRGIAGKNVDSTKRIRSM